MNVLIKKLGLWAACLAPGTFSSIMKYKSMHQECQFQRMQDAKMDEKNNSSLVATRYEKYSFNLDSCDFNKFSDTISAFGTLGLSGVVVGVVGTNKINKKQEKSKKQRLIDSVRKAFHSFISDDDNREYIENSGIEKFFNNINEITDVVARESRKESQITSRSSSKTVISEKYQNSADHLRRISEQFTDKEKEKLLLTLREDYEQNRCSSITRKHSLSSSLSIKDQVKQSPLESQNENSTHHKQRLTLSSESFQRQSSPFTSSVTESNFSIGVAIMEETIDDNYESSSSARSNSTILDDSRKNSSKLPRPSPISPTASQYKQQNKNNKSSI